MNIKNIRKNEKGLTLIETVIYMGLLSILLVVLTDMLVSILDLRLETQAVSAVDQDGKFIIQRLNYDVSRSDSITTPANPGDTSSTLVLDIDGESYTYSISGNQLDLTNNSGTQSLSGSESIISDLEFRKLGPAAKRTVVQTEFTVTSDAELNKGTEVRNFRTVFGVRQ